MLGGNVFGWTIDEHARSSARRVHRRGLQLVDTADTIRLGAGQSGGESETIIGNWIKRSGKRDKMVIATKVG